MSRKNRGPNIHQVTVYMSPEFMAQLDSYIVGMGIENRASGLLALAHAGMSALPLEAMIGQVLTQAVKDLKKGEFQALADFYDGRAQALAAALR